MGLMSLRELLCARPESDDPLARHGTGSHPGAKDRKKASASLVADGEQLAGLQEKLFAEDKRMLLLVLQGIDTSGKDGTIKHVIGQVNPLGCKIKSFKAPTPEEAKHHFLWRIRRALPEPGQVGVFGRSHYEDVIVPRVHGGLSDRDIDRRYAEIAKFAAINAKLTDEIDKLNKTSFEVADGETGPAPGARPLRPAPEARQHAADPGRGRGAGPLGAGLLRGGGKLTPGGRSPYRGHPEERSEEGSQT